MKSKSSVIVINGRHYDAHTGEPMHGRQGAPEASAQHHAPAPAVSAGHEPQITPKPHTVRTSADYRPTRHLKPHQAQHAHTLMRQAVKKPAPGPRRHIKVQGSLRAGGRESSRIITHRAPASYAHHARNHAVKTTHSRLISHFSPELFLVDDHTSLAAYGSGAVGRTAHRPERPPARRPTTDELLDFAVQYANVPRHEVTRHRRRLIRHPHAGRRA